MKRLIFTLIVSIGVVYSSVYSLAYNISSDGEVIKAGETTKILITDDDGNEVTGSWTSDNTDVARVDEHGNITGLSNGQSKITFTDNKEFEKTFIIGVESNTKEYYNELYIVAEKYDDETDIDGTIAPGVYIVMATEDDANITIESGNEENILGIKYNSDVKYNTIISVDENDRIRQHGCKIVSLDTELDTTGSGVFLVGTHVPAGEYVVETDNSLDGTVEIYEDYDYADCIAALPVEQDSPQHVSLADGNVIVLNGCKLSNM